MRNGWFLYNDVDGYGNCKTASFVNGSGLLKDIFILSALSDTQTNTSSLIEIVNSLEIVNSRYQEQSLYHQL